MRPAGKPFAQGSGTQLGMHTGSSPVDVPTLSYRAPELKVFWAIGKLEGAVGEG